MIYLFYIFYPKELRELIKKLKSEGKLIEKPLINLNLVMLGLCVVLCMPLTAYKMFEDADAMLLFMASLGCIILIIRSYCKNYILPASKGVLTRGKIIGRPCLRGSLPFPLPFQKKVWVIKYSMLKSKITGKTYRMKVPEKYLNIGQLSDSDIVKVLYLESNPDHNLIILEEILNLSCIDLKIIEKRNKE